MAKRKLKSKGKVPAKPANNNRTKGRHSKVTVRWGTPQDVLERERAVFYALARNDREKDYPIDIDPFTEDRFNEIVQASTAYSLRERKENGLKLPWSVPITGYGAPDVGDERTASRAHINHPGGLTVEAWAKLIAEHYAGNVRAAFWIGFSVEQLAILADAQPHPLDFSCVILRKRIKFVPHMRKAKGKNTPSHANYIVAIGVPVSLFDEHFSDLGKVVHGYECTLETMAHLRNRAPEVAAQLDAERAPPGVREVVIEQTIGTEHKLEREIETMPPVMVCSCGAEFRSLDALNDHAIAKGGLMHGDAPTEIAAIDVAGMHSVHDAHDAQLANDGEALPLPFTTRMALKHPDGTGCSDQHCGWLPSCKGNDHAMGRA